MSVQLNITTSYSQNNATLLDLFLKMLYTFQAVPPPIIRSTQLYKQLQVLSTNTAAAATVDEKELVRVKAELI
jgi:hypothetical protein